MGKTLEVVMNYANEDVASIHKHWIIFLKTTINVLIRITFFLFAYFKGRIYIEFLADSINYYVPVIPFEIKKFILPAIVLYLTVKTVWSYVETYQEYKTVALAINNIQIKGVSGLFDIGVVNASLEQVSYVKVYVPFWGGIFHYGTIEISLDGRTFSLRHMVQVEEFQNAIILLQEAQKEGRNIRQDERHDESLQRHTMQQAQILTAISQDMKQAIMQQQNNSITGNEKNLLETEVMNEEMKQD